MSSNPAGDTAWSRGFAFVNRLLPPVRSSRFWIVQSGVLLVAFLDEIIYDLFGVSHTFHIPRSTITGLLLVPVIYAALNFGVRGSISTGIWATVLMFHDWIFVHGISGITEWGETGSLVIVNVVAIVVGQRVEREAKALARTEMALRSSELAEKRYRALFDAQHAPILVTDSLGKIIEVNAAAESLFGENSLGKLLPNLLQISVESVLQGTSRVVVGERVFTPLARPLDADPIGRIIQIVMVDITEEESRAREQKAYARHLVKVQEDERRRLAQDLHDDPVQTLTYLVRTLERLASDPKLPTELVPLVHHDGQLISNVVDTLRSVIHGLRPPVLDDFGAVAALRQLVAEFEKRYSQPITMKVHGNEVRLSSESELAVFRVAQEALTNVVRHAHSTHTRLDLNFSEQVVLTITDDGVGIIPTEPSYSIGVDRLGLLGMRERVSLVGGTLQVNRRKPRGTIVRATFPLIPSDSEALTSS